MAFILSHRFLNNFIVSWPMFLYKTYISSLAHMIPDSLSALRSGSYWLNPNGELSAAQMIGVFELSYGLPMLVLALLAGVLARRNSTVTDPIK